MFFFQLSLLARAIAMFIIMILLAFSHKVYLYLFFDPRGDLREKGKGIELQRPCLMGTTWYFFMAGQPTLR